MYTVIFESSSKADSETCHPDGHELLTGSGRKRLAWAPEGLGKNVDVSSTSAGVSIHCDFWGRQRSSSTVGPSLSPMLLGIPSQDTYLNPALWPLH